MDGVTPDGVLPNVVVNHPVEKGKIHDGVAMHLAMRALDKTPQQVAEMIARARQTFRLSNGKAPKQ